MFRCFLLSILECEGGILILPISFFTTSKCKVRERFLMTFKIFLVSYFEEKVFDDTGINIVAISFSKSEEKLTEQNIRWKRFPNNDSKVFLFRNGNLETEIYHLEISKKYKVKRYLEGYQLKENEFLTSLTLRALDIGEKLIALEYLEDFCYQGKNTSRTYATLILVGIELTPKRQRALARSFNRFLSEQRVKTWDLCLPDYRENGRKRIPFEIAYQMILSLLINI